MSLTSWDNNVVGYYGPAIFLAKSGSSTIGTNSRVSNQNSILEFIGSKLIGSIFMSIIV